MICSALVIGLIGSLHCVGMCGPIALMLPLNRNNPVVAFFQIMQYHLGRILSYSFLGLLFGLFGRGLFVAGMQQKLSLWLGALLIAGLLMSYFFRLKIPAFKPYTRLLMRLQSSMGEQLKKRSPHTTFLMGLLNGFLPCGMVYMALFGAVAMGKPAEGAIYMIAFGLGTVPLMSAVAFLGKKLPQVFRVNFRRLTPLFVLIIGVYFMIRGAGLNNYWSPALQQMQVKTQADCVSPAMHGNR